MIFYAIVAIDHAFAITLAILAPGTILIIRNAKSGIILAISVAEGFTEL
ncbi:MAG: hypothetical protein KZY61_12105 [Clostridiaceae bacterium]|nr:hypothetical protein [Clostridiaceae bacterium]MBW4859364.1 hypothetical protein [Clostridiaceae bacterium]MBW4869372.1 hypothetical protein [Clostridiaceae bacterium]